MSTAKGNPHETEPSSSPRKSTPSPRSKESESNPNPAPIRDGTTTTPRDHPSRVRAPEETGLTPDPSTNHDHQKANDATPGGLGLTEAEVKQWMDEWDELLDRSRKDVEGYRERLKAEGHPLFVGGPCEVSGAESGYLDC